MKPFSIVLKLIVAVLFVGCNPSIETRIEKEFFQYADKNFDDPASIDEITSVSLSDSIDMEELFSNIMIIVEDSLFTKDLQEGDILDRLSKLPRYKIYEIGYYAEDYLEKSLDIYRFKKDNNHRIAYLRDTINTYISNVNKSDLGIWYSYEIKVRVKNEDKKQILIYYAIVDANNIIHIQDHILKTEEVPVLNGILKYTNEYFALRDSYLDLCDKLKKSRNELIIRL